jgi:DNA-binding transcriptional LysR family regulator
MKKSELANVNFSALKTLKVVRDLGSISMAAQQLDLDQSAVSHTLGRLRRLFGDPLFVRVDRGIAATERCSEIVEEVADLLERFERLTSSRTFDPATAEFEFVVALSHAARTVLLVPVIRYLRTHAPGIRVRVLQSRDAADAALEAGSCHLLIRPLPFEPVAYHRRHLLRTRYVCMVDRNSPYAARGITLEEYAAANHVLISFEGLFRPPWQSMMESLDLAVRVSLDLASTSEIDQFVAGTDLVATLSEQHARLYGDGVAVIEPPLDVFQDVYMFWTDKTHELEHMRWVRDRFAGAARDLESHPAG